MVAGLKRTFLLAAPALWLIGSGGVAPALATVYRIEATTRGNELRAPREGNETIIETIQGLVGGRSTSESSSHRLRLRLDATESPAAAEGEQVAPEGEHLIPAGLLMGRALPLRNSDGDGNDAAGQTTEEGPSTQKPAAALPVAGGLAEKGRLLIYRGCAEAGGSAAAEVIDLKDLPAEKRRMATEALRKARAIHLSGGTGSGGMVAADRTIRWPRDSGSGKVPPTASLVGEHRIVSNVAPEISFRVDRAHDFLPPLRLGVSSDGQARRLGWQPLPSALGFQALAMGTGRQPDDVVIWTSSTAPWEDSAVPWKLRVAGAEDLVRRGVLLSPQQTSCTIRAEAMDQLETAMVSLAAFGDTLVLSSPPGAPAWQLSLERLSITSQPLFITSGAEKGLDGNGEQPRRRGGGRGFSLFRTWF